MGGGKDQKTANTQLTQQAAYQNTQQKAFDTRNTADLDASRGRGDELYGDLRSGYKALASGDPSTQIQGGNGGGGGGGYSAPALDPRFQNVEDKYKSFMDTGGWDKDTKEGQQGRINALTEIGKTGGISDADQARARGGGVYDEFSKTGGFSDKDVANIRSRGTSGIPAMYDRVRAEQNRGAAISGGYGPGRGVLAGRMARQQAGATADASLNTELGIKNQVNQGRLAGASGMSSSELALQGQLSGNKLAGLTGGNEAQQKMQESIMGGQQWGTQGEYGLVNMEQQRADQQAAAAAAASSSASANDRWAQQFNLSQKAAGLEGLQSLYSGPGAGEYNVNKDFALQSAGGYGDQITGGSTALKSNNKSAWDTVGQVAGAVAGGMTGMGAISAGIGAARAGAAAAQR